MIKLVDLLTESMVSKLYQKAKEKLAQLDRWLDGEYAKNDDDEQLFKALQQKEEEAWKIYNKNPDASANPETGKLDYTPDSNYARVHNIAKLIGDFWELIKTTKVDSEERSEGRGEILNKLNQIQM